MRYSTGLQECPRLALAFSGVRFKCRGQPEPALYNGGILKFGNSDDPDGYRTTETGVFSPAFVVYNLNKTTMYTFSCELLHACSPPFQCDELLQSCELQ